MHEFTDDRASGHDHKWDSPTWGGRPSREDSTAHTSDVEKCALCGHDHGRDDDCDFSEHAELEGTVRFTLQAGRLVARTVERELRLNAFEAGVHCTIEESKGLLDIAFMVTVKGPKVKLERFRDVMVEWLTFIEKNERHDEGSQMRVLRDGMAKIQIHR